MADGNFKADHVRQSNTDGDVWLSEGSGMIPKRREYMSFLKTAIEKLTVCFKYITGPMATRPLTHSSEGTL